MALLSLPRRALIENFNLYSYSLGKRTLFFIINVTTSLSGLFYFLLISKEAAQLTGEEYYFQSLPLGIYLLFMGIGALRTPKIQNENEFYRALILRQGGLALVGSLGPLILLGILSYLSLTNLNFPTSPQELPLKPIMSIILILVLIQGYLLGAEVPLFLKMASKQREKNSLLFLNYVGALFAGPLLNFLMAQSLEGESLISFALIIGFVEAIALLFFAPKYSVALITILSGCYSLNETYLQKTQSILLHSYYQGIKAAGRDLSKVIDDMDKIGKIEQWIDPYQRIHLVYENPVSNSAFPGNLTLYLNHRPQFDLYTYTTYHESMLHGALNLGKGSFKNILILGGGDGLLATTIKNRLPKTHLTQVELDPLMIELASTHPSLKKLNHHSLTRGTVDELIIGDGFHFLRQTQKTYDLIFIDFPYPYSDELLGLYSQEFYSVVKKRLSPHGMSVIDFPLTKKLASQAKEGVSKLGQRHYETLKAAGFDHIFAYGPYSSFVIAANSEQPKDFDYERLSQEKIRPSTALNMVKLNFLYHNDMRSTPIGLFYGK